MRADMDFNSRFDNIRLNDLDYIEKDTKSIISDIEFKTSEQELLCEDIITHLESTAAKEILNDKCVQLPFIGALRKNPLKKTLEDNRAKFKSLSKHLSKEDFKEYTKEVFANKKKELRKADYEKAKFKEIRNKYKSKYETYYKILGAAYANFFIKSIMMMEIIEFNQEFEDRMQELYKYE